MGIKANLLPSLLNMCSHSIFLRLDDFPSGKTHVKFVTSLAIEVTIKLVTPPYSGQRGLKKTIDFIAHSKLILWLV